MYFSAINFPFCYCRFRQKCIKVPVEWPKGKWPLRKSKHRLENINIFISRKSCGSKWTGFFQLGTRNGDEIFKHGNKGLSYMKAKIA
jgi:hypothetical protein